MCMHFYITGKVFKKGFSIRSCWWTQCWESIIQLHMKRQFNWWWYSCAPFKLKQCIFLLLTSQIHTIPKNHLIWQVSDLIYESQMHRIYVDNWTNILFLILLIFFVLYLNCILVELCFIAWICVSPWHDTCVTQFTSGDVGSPMNFQMCLMVSTTSTGRPIKDIIDLKWIIIIIIKLSVNS